MGSHSKLYYGSLIYCGLVPHHPLFLLREHPPQSAETVPQVFFFYKKIKK